MSVVNLEILFVIDAPNSEDEEKIFGCAAAGGGGGGVVATDLA